MVSGCSKRIASTQYYISSSQVEKCVIKWSQQVSLMLCWPCDPQQCQGLSKWYKMVGVHSAYKHGRYERIWLINLHAMSNVKLIHTRRQASWMNMTDYIDQHVSVHVSMQAHVYAHARMRAHTHTRIHTYIYTQTTYRITSAHQCRCAESQERNMGTHRCRCTHMNFIIFFYWRKRSNKLANTGQYVETVESRSHWKFSKTNPNVNGIMCLPVTNTKCQTAN